jgi:hypothetical protein
MAMTVEPAAPRDRGVLRATSIYRCSSSPVRSEPLGEVKMSPQMPEHDPILEAAAGTMRQLVAVRAAPVARLLTEVGTSFDLDATQRADLADAFASELHAEHIQNRLAAERASVPPTNGAQLGRSLKAVGALSVVCAMMTLLLTLAASGTFGNARQLLSDSNHLDTVEAVDMH